MQNQFTTMSLNEIYRQWGPQIDDLSRKIAVKINYDFNLKGGELADDAVAKTWIAMPKLLKDYDPSICPLLPYLGQRINWLFMSEKRKNARRAEKEVLPFENESGEPDPCENHVDFEKFIESERKQNVRNALSKLLEEMPAGKHLDCLKAHVKQMQDESLDLPSVLNCSRQYVHILKKGIPAQVPAKLSAEIRELLHKDDTATIYGVKTKTKAYAS